MVLRTLLGLFFVGTITSISLMDAVVTLLGLRLAFKYFKNRDLKKLSLNGIGWVLVAWFAIVVLGLLLASATLSSARGAIFDLRWMINLIILSYSFRELFSTYNEESVVPKWLLIVSSLVLLHAISISFLGYDFLRPGRNNFHSINFLGGVRTHGLLDNPMFFAHAIGYFCCWIASLVLLRWKKNYRWVIGLSLLVVSALFLSFTRGAWLSVGMSCLVMTFMVRRRWAIGLVFVGVSAMVFLLVTSEGIRQRVITASRPTDQSNQERLVLWHTNIEMFKDHPILGIGYEQYKIKLPEYYAKDGVPVGFFQSHAHNQFLHQLAGTGALGFSAYILFIFMIFRMAHIQWKKSTQLGVPKESQGLNALLALATMGAMTHLFWGGLFESNFEETVSVHGLVLILGAYYGRCG